MKHATNEALDKVECLLTKLRTLESLKERKRGIFYHKSKSFLHFHESGSDVYVDFKKDGKDFHRELVISDEQQRKVFDCIKDVLEK